MTTREEQHLRVRINCTIDGEPAMWLSDVKRRGIAASNREAVVQGLRALEEKLTAEDLKRAQLRTLADTEN